MDKLKSTRIHLDIAKNCPHSEVCVQRFNNSLREYVGFVALTKRRWEDICDASRGVNEQYQITTQIRRKLSNIRRKFIAWKCKVLGIFYKRVR